MIRAHAWLQHFQMASLRRGILDQAASGVVLQIWTVLLIPYYFTHEAELTSSEVQNLLKQLLEAVVLVTSPYLS